MDVSSDKRRHGVILLGPDRLFRETLARTLATANFEVVHVASAPDEVSMDEFASAEDRILVADLDENEEDAIKLFSEARKLQPNLKIVVITQSGLPTMVDACLEIGVHAYISKDTSFDSFLNYLSFVALNEKVLPVELAASFMARRSEASSPVPFKDVDANFSDRERAILTYLVQGESNKEIARHLGIADGTVKVGVKAILRKIDASNRTQAAIWALQHGSCTNPLDDIDCLDGEPAAALRANGRRHERRPELDPESAMSKKLFQFEDVANPVR